MFNGLIREIAEVASFGGENLRLRAKFRPSLGDSIAINGACLSVTKLFSDGFCVQVSDESRVSLAIENFTGKVHIEPAMHLGDRIDGHLMQGHIDAIGKIVQIDRLDVGFNFFIEIPQNIAHLVANKGSIAIDGVSLTINEVFESQIRLTLIPLSMKDTLFASYRVGRRVNIESDLLARYAARILGFGSANSRLNSRVNSSSKNELSWEEAELYARIF